jgi:hypothetical protein
MEADGGKILSELSKVWKSTQPDFAELAITDFDH